MKKATGCVSTVAIRETTKVAKKSPARARSFFLLLGLTLLLCGLVAEAFGVWL